MKRSDDSSIVSLESHRRRRQAERRKRPPKPAHERAINWGKAPRFLVAVVLFMALAWVIRWIAAFANPFG